jgi:hypothetical protein
MRGLALVVLLCGACSVDAAAPDAAPAGRPERNVRLPRSSFIARAGVLVAPVVGSDGERIEQVSADVRCAAPCGVLLCVTATDPRSNGSTAVLEVCAPRTPCGPTTGIVEVALSSLFVGEVADVPRGLYVVGAGAAIEMTLEPGDVEPRGATVEITSPQPGVAE